MGSRDCIYGPCGDCEYQDSIDDEGICEMYDPECNYPDEEEDDDNENDNEEENDDDGDDW